MQYIWIETLEQSKIISAPKKNKLKAYKGHAQFLTTKKAKNKSTILQKNGTNYKQQTQGCTARKEKENDTGTDGMIAVLWWW